MKRRKILIVFNYVPVPVPLIKYYAEAYQLTLFRHLNTYLTLHQQRLQVLRLVRALKRATTVFLQS